MKPERDRKTETQRDRDTERQRDRYRGRKRDKRVLINEGCSKKTPQKPKKSKKDSPILAFNFE